ncbi:hypothetical protein SB30_240039 [Klebsiella quasipneumoniae subsp. similipneumoniae]|nr:hypothetical protein SB30_240039 [Klebsiella quasipneumoniae subsp. similipneumoniae]
MDNLRFVTPLFLHDDMQWDCGSGWVMSAVCQV